MVDAPAAAAAVAVLSTGRNPSAMLDRPVPGDLPPGVLFDRRHPAPPRMWWRTAAFVSVALAGLWVPLQRSLDDIDSQSPLALVGWALPLAVAVALHGIRSEPDPTEARPQRSADGFIAACAFAVGLLCAFAAPAAFGWETAAARPELLAAPGLLAGWIVVFFGSRALWLARRGIALAVAACPVWYGWLVPPLQRLGIEVAWPPVVAVGKLLGVTTTDAAGLHAAGFGDGTMVVLGATCAGASTVLGVGLVLTAAASVLRGSTAAKVRWVLAGSAAALLANAIRLAVLVMVGALVSPAAALQVVHPVAGVVMALATTAVALGTSRRFGLAVPVTPRRRIDDRLAGCAPRRITAAAAVAVVVAAGANVAYASMWQLDRLGGASADDNVDASMTIDTVAADLGLVAREAEPVSWVQQFYGQSTWRRHVLFDGAGAPPVTIDVTTASDAESIERLDLATCYGFHGFEAEHEIGIDGMGDRPAERFAFDEGGARTEVLTWQTRVPGGVQRVVVSQLDGRRDTVLRVAAALSAATVVQR
ncbi:MAG: archaeosortase/exosortase family protein [Acidimicrobiales bacterium]|nr:archaeosortase/exosortase family protein [Acidimicrobiales bacterium]MCB9395572.1 archaeosortase/exosortase family protein [Acidimicrobiaceae bacterium]